jgi:hypothetical protein
MAGERFWRIHWAIAVWHNIIGGVGLIFLGDWIYTREGLEPPVPGVNYVRWMLLILVFAYVYYMIRRDLYNTEKLVRASIFAKIASASPDLYYLLFKSGVPRIFWTTVVTDYVFAVTFFLFLRWVARHKAMAGSNGSGGFVTTSR